MTDVIDMVNDPMKVTQREVDSSFLVVKAAWDDMVKKSGKAEAVFICTDDNAASFLHLYKMAKESVEAKGLTMPELIKGLKITIN